jgi:RNA polymerase sigma-70 factor (ECF subfamily)
MTDTRGQLAPDTPDAELIERVLAGERDLYRILVQRYQRSLFRVAYTMVLDRDTAEDLVQDAFVRAYVNLARCRNRARFRYWLLSTLRNRALDHVKEKRRRDVSLSDEHVVRRVEVGAASPDPADQMSIRSALEGMLDRLSPPLREAFVLRHIEECSFEEVARLLGTGVSAVKMRVHRARQQLAEWLGEEADVAHPPRDVTGRRAQSS